MKFLVLMMTFLILYSTNLNSKVQAGSLFDSYLKIIDNFLDGMKVKIAAVRLTLMLVIFSLVIVLVYFLLMKLSGVLAFLFSIFILFCCFSEVRFSADDFPLVILNQAVEQLFAILFWYLILGPVGAVVYVLNDHIRRMHVSAEISNYAAQAQLWFDWIPVRLLAFCFALIGHFTAVSQVWVKSVWSPPQDNEAFFLLCFNAASVKENLASKENCIVSEYLIKLIYRSLVVWFIVIALFTLL